MSSNRAAPSAHSEQEGRPRALARFGRAEVALGLVTVFFALATAAWINLDTVPPHWDEAHYLYESELLYHALLDQGPGAFLSGFSRAIGSKAPLITVLPFPFYFVLGEGFLSARYINVAFVVLASWYLFQLGAIVAGRRAALLTVVILNTFPLVAGMSRQFLVEYGLMTLVILWMNYLVRWQRGEDKGPAWALGLVLGLGMLMKVTFPLYVAAPTAFVLIQDVIRHRRLRPATLASLARVAGVGLPIAAIWYFRNWTSVFGFVLKAGYGEWARAYGKGSVFSLRSVAGYWLELINYGIAASTFLLLLLVACWLGARRWRGQDGSGLAKDHLVLLWTWWIVPWLALSFAVNKDLRYSVPYLPALALLLSAGLARIAGRRYGVAVPGLVAAAGILSYIYCSFGPPKPAGVELRAGGLIFLSNDLLWAHPPTPEKWPNERIARLVAEDAAARGLAQPKGSVLFSHFRLSAHNLNYLAALHRSPVRFNTYHFQMTEPASELARRVRSQADYVLTKSAHQGAPLLNAKNLEVLKLLEEDGFPFDRIATFPLPDGSEARVFRRGKPGGFRVWKLEDYLRAHAVSARASARFGNAIALLDSNVSPAADGFRVTLVWHCIAPIAEDLRVFVHVIDPGGKPYAIADYFPAQGAHPTSRWATGDVVEDELWIPKPLPAGHRIFVGWYHLQRRSQLPRAGERAPWPGEPNAEQIY